MSEGVLERFSRTKVWSRGSQRAPHKPLLILIALAHWQRGQHDVRYAEVESDLISLLEEFGPSRKTYHANYPFWRLKNDGIWDVVADWDLESAYGTTKDPPVSVLRRASAVGRFSRDVAECLAEDPSLVARLGIALVDAHFPDTVHADLLGAIGLEVNGELARPSQRDPAFRRSVLAVYEYKCAICGLDLRLGPHSVGLEAAHIKWVQAGGPNTVTNGFALCPTHHKALDLGVLMVDTKLRVVVSERAHGGSAFKNVIMRHHGERISVPERSEYGPAPSYLAWHKREVFKAPARLLPQMHS